MVKVIRQNNNNDYTPYYVYSSNDDMLHYGRKGMKWGQNIFEKAASAARTYGSAAYNSGAGMAARYRVNQARQVARNAYNSQAGQNLRSAARQYGSQARQYGRQAYSAARQYGKQAYNSQAGQNLRSAGRSALSSARQYGSQAKQYGISALGKAKQYGNQAYNSQAGQNLRSKMSGLANKAYNSNAGKRLYLGAATVQDFASTKLSKFSGANSKAGSRFVEQSNYMKQSISSLTSKNSMNQLADNAPSRMALAKDSGFMNSNRYHQAMKSETFSARNNKNISDPRQHARDNMKKRINSGEFDDFLTGKKDGNDGYAFPTRAEREAKRQRELKRKAKLAALGLDDD